MKEMHLISLNFQKVIKKSSVVEGARFRESILTKLETESSAIKHIKKQVYKPDSVSH